MNGRHAQAPGLTLADTRPNSNAARTLKGAKKQRAPQACESCRARKVRCNVNKQGIPCTNCTIDELQCVVGENRRKRRRTDSSDPRESTEHEASIVLPASTTPDHSVPSNYSVAWEPADPQRPTWNPALPPQHDLPPSSAISPNLTLPIYIKQLPERFGPDDVTYLRNKGALAIPDHQLRDELLSCYAAYVHPLMPLLDLQAFIRTIDQDDGEHPVSLLLFQAVMFSGIATADATILTTAGYSDRREARRTFFNRTRLLYDLDYEDDSIALVQALLLMSFWREEPQARKETQHWIEIAVSLLQKAGLHREPEDSGQVDSSQTLRRRIWWSAYVRDVQIALGTRRPTLIHDVDFDMRMLEQGDFGVISLTDVNSWNRIPSNQQALNAACIEQVKLCLCISHVLSTQYGVANSKGSRRTARMLFGESSQPSHGDLPGTDKKLQEWHEKLPSSVRVGLEGLQSDRNPNDTCHLITCAALHMFYHAGRSSLHRLQLLTPSTKPPHPAHPPPTDALHKALQLAATEITATAGTLLRANLVRYLPSWTITVLLPAIIHHLSRALSLDHRVRHFSLQRYSLCMQAMAALRDMYAAADYSTAFLQAAIQRTEIGPLTQETEEDRKAYDALTSAPDLADSGMNMPSATTSPRSGALDIAGSVEDAAVSLTSAYSLPLSAEQHGHGQTGVSTGLQDSALAPWAGFAEHGASPPPPESVVHHRNAASLAIDDAANNNNDDGAQQGLAFAFTPVRVPESGFALDADWFAGIGTEDLTMMGGFEEHGTAL